MNLLITGSTGMIGQLVLQQALEQVAVTEVRTLVRKPSNYLHPKLREFVVSDFTTLESYAAAFENVTAAYFCLGAYTGNVSTEELKVITVDYAVHFGKQLAAMSPGATLCLLSGAGADRSEKSSTPFARFKGMAENQLAALPLRFYALRPGYIYPSTPRVEPNWMYRLTRFLYPVIRCLGPQYSIPSADLGRVLFTVGIHGAEKEILENRDLVRLTKQLLANS